MAAANAASGRWRWVAVANAESGRWRRVAAANADAVEIIWQLVPSVTAIVASTIAVPRWIASCAEVAWQCGENFCIVLICCSFKCSVSPATKLDLHIRVLTCAVVGEGSAVCCECLFRPHRSTPFQWEDGLFALEEREMW